jgi:hypothetical protein
MMMDTALLARQRHHERIEHALGPRPEPHGPVARPSTKRSPSCLGSHIWCAYPRS